MNHTIPKVVSASLLLTIASWTCRLALADNDSPGSCGVVQQGKQVELCSPSFVFRLDTTTGLRAQSWENRLTGKTIKLGDGPELEIDIGLPDRPLQTPLWEVSNVRINREGTAGEVVFSLTSKDLMASALVTYRWDAQQPVLRKFVEITNQSDRPWDRLLNIRLGTYRPDATIVCPPPLPAPSYPNVPHRGFPVYLNGEFFVSLAHPASLVTVENGQVTLRQYPGAKLSPGKAFGCMEAVYGVAKAGEARCAFVTHLRGRMRRVVRGHDKPYAVFDNFGSWPAPWRSPSGESAHIFMNSESFMLHSLGRLAESQKGTGCRFDVCNIHFWVDYHGDLKRWDPQRFPNGITRTGEALKQLGTAPGLWIDSSHEAGSIGGNPAVRNTFNCGPEKDLSSLPWYRLSLCRATEPIKSMYTEAFRYHIRHNGVRLLKFDNFATVCINPTHDHLPGIYSTEPIVDSVIEFLHALDAECPDVFLVLYWGYTSPWWLLHGDTIFDSGIGIEAAHPSDSPAPFARDSVTQKLDQAQWHTQHVTDIPVLGKDSLGIWLSDWGWNCSIGKERWQEGFVMDLCRGSLLAQIWADNDWLSPPEWKQLADFIALLRTRPACFGNPRFVLGNPWNNEPYGYCCTDGKRAFLALNNCTWQDQSLPLELNSSWGLPDGKTWDLYRWYPEPARLKGDRESFDSKTAISLRPFEVVLLEAVPAGLPPTLDRSFSTQPLPAHFAEPSREVAVTACLVDGQADTVPPAEGSRRFVIQAQSPAAERGGTLVIVTKLSKGATAFSLPDIGTHFSVEAKLGDQRLPYQPVLGKAAFPCPWQAWRIAVPPSSEPQPLEMQIDASISNDVEPKWSGYFLPR